MGAVKGWVMDMEQDAVEMTRDQFIKIHGKFNADIWDRMNDPDYVDPDWADGGVEYFGA